MFGIKTREYDNNGEKITTFAPVKLYNCSEWSPNRYFI